MVQEVSMNGGNKKRRTRSKSKSRRGKKGGTFLGDVSVPAGLLFLNELMKRKSSKSSKSSKKSRSKSRKMKRSSKKR